MLHLAFGKGGARMTFDFISNASYSDKPKHDCVLCDSLPTKRNHNHVIDGVELKFN